MGTVHAIESWLYPTPRGLYCAAGDFYIDPVAAVDRAVITHGHADHARPGHASVLATPETLAIMKLRMGDGIPATAEALPYGQAQKIGDVTISLHPAGHVLGSGQVLMQYKGQRAVITGDFKRRADETCAPFEVVPCDVFITEATFGLPVFRHPPDSAEIAKLLDSQSLFPDSGHLIGAYALGKAQRVIRLLRSAGYDAPLYLHGALQNMCTLYEELGVSLGALRDATSAKKAELAGQLVMAPPGALQDRWSRRIPDVITAMASGWMRVRARARQRGADIPLIISDHADWEELTQTVRDVNPETLWVTHGREDALVHWAQNEGYDAKALALVGYDEDET